MDAAGAGRAGSRRSRRLIPLSLHRGVEASLGLFLVIFPILASFSPGAFLTFSVETVFVGGALGLALTLLGFSGTREGRYVAPKLHATLDLVVIAGFAAAVLVFAATGEGSGTILFAAVGLVHAAITAATSYSREVRPESPGGTTVSSDEEAGL